MIFSYKKIKYLLSIFVLLLIFCTSCTKTVNNKNTTNSNNKTSQNIPVVKTGDESDPSTTKSSISSEQTSSKQTNINVKDNPGDEGYTWTPGEH